MCWTGPTASEPEEFSHICQSSNQDHCSGETTMASQSEIRESITADLIALLKEGTKPWQKPWSSDPNCSGLPRSISTGKAYSGINVLILEAAAMARSYSSSIW